MDHSAIPAPRPDTRAARFVAVGAAGGVIGLLPWLATGPFLPLQNLGEGQDPSRPGPVALLPFSQYEIVTIIALIVVGGATAGLLARALGSTSTGRRTVAALGGLALVQVVAILQTIVVVADTLQQRSESLVYLALLTGVAALATLVSWSAAALVAAAPRAGAGLGLSIGAMATATWVSTWLSPVSAYDSPFLDVLPLTTYIGPILVGAAIAWTGVGTPGRVASAFAGAALVWLVPALTTALSSAAGTRVLAKDLPAMADFGMGVFVSALTLPDLVLRYLAAMVVTAGIGLALRAVLARLRANDTAAPTTTPR